MKCKNCGVYLDVSMLECPLCGASVHADETAAPPSSNKPLVKTGRKQAEDQRRQQRVWELISITLLSAIIATLVVNLLIDKRITWSEYPVAICLVVFSYISLFVFFDRGMLFKIGGGFMLSSVLILVLDVLTGGAQWAPRFGIPLLFALALIVAVLISGIRRTKYRGMNLVAYSLIAAAIMCLCVEGILAFFLYGYVRFRWSTIVVLCVIPIVIVLLYMHFRLRKGMDLQRTFHV